MFALKVFTLPTRLKVTMPRQSKSEASKHKEAARLTSLRKALGMTQVDLAKEFKVTRQAFSMWERGERTIPGPVLRLIEMYEEKLSSKKR
jgi:DNA-binding transcriptional regulator YiaG